MRHARKFAALGCASLALGSLLAMTTPTQPRTARNSQIDELAAPQIAAYPGAGHEVLGQDSYPVTYSPQFLAISERAERARMKQWDMPPLPGVNYDQPPAARDAAIEREGIRDVAVHRGGQPAAAAPEQDPDDLALNDSPQG
jgi:hypothetical protein